MRQIIILILLIVSSHSCQVLQKNSEENSSEQEAIDLKKLIGKSQEDALHYLDNCEIKVSLSSKYEDLWIGFNEGIQIKVKDGTVNTIWVEFTERRSGAFPFQVDNVVTPNIDINKVISTYGNPDKTGNGGKIGDTDLGGWVKWITKSYQLHCEIIDSKVVMVTIMESHWNPDKE